MRSAMNAVKPVATAVLGRPKAGEVRLSIPKLHQQTFETAIIERRSPFTDRGQ